MKKCNYCGQDCADEYCIIDKKGLIKCFDCLTTEDDTVIKFFGILAIMIVFYKFIF